MVVKILTKKQILDADDVKKELVKVPEWGGAVYVWSMTASDKDQFEMSIVEADVDKKGKMVRTNKLDNYRAKLCVLCIKDAKGKPIFDENDITALGKKSAAALQRVFNAATKLNRITEDDIEEQIKN